MKKDIVRCKRSRKILAEDDRIKTSAATQESISPEKSKWVSKRVLALFLTQVAFAQILELKMGRMLNLGLRLGCFVFSLLASMP